MQLHTDLSFRGFLSTYMYVCLGMEIRHKSSEVVQSQIAAFASERVEKYTERHEALRAITDTALAAALRNSQGEQFTQYLRDVGGSSYESVRGRVALLHNYGVFKSVVDDLKYGIGQLDQPDLHPAFLGEGANSRVFAADVGNTLYAVRIPKQTERNPSIIDGHLAAGLLSKKCVHLEQLVAASYEEGVTVAELVPGVDLGKITPYELQQVTDEHIHTLVDTLIESQRRGINIDPKPTNILYDPLEGYGIVDYQAPGDFLFQGEGETIGAMAVSLSRAGLYGRDLDYADLAVYKYLHSVHTANDEVLTRYQAVVANKLCGEERERALERIGFAVHATRRSRIEAADEACIAARIVRAAQRQQD